jgi:hypothetical protein
MDVVIPTTAKDYATLHECVASVFRYVADARHVYLVSREKPPLDALSARDRARVRWVDEESGPVTFKQAARYVGSRGAGAGGGGGSSGGGGGSSGGGSSSGSGSSSGGGGGVSENFHRLGWLFQQCIKLEASKWCGPQLSRRHLVCDSDVVFFRPVAMVENGVSLLSWQPDYLHAPYFEHAERLTGGRVKRVDPHMSGIAHHMVFDEVCLDALRRDVATTSSDGAPLWRAFLQWVVLPPGGTAAASEYELYFNFALAGFPGTHRARALRIRDNSGVFGRDPSSYLLKQCKHHSRTVGRRNPARDGRDTRDWHFAAYHCRTLPIWQFLTLKDEATKIRVRANPQLAIDAMLLFKDKPQYRGKGEEEGGGGEDEVFPERMVEKVRGAVAVEEVVMVMVEEEDDEDDKVLVVVEEDDDEEENEDDDEEESDVPVEDLD